MTDMKHLHGLLKKEVVFNFMGGTFQHMPDPVKNTIHASYPGRVDDDDTEYVEEATGATYYLIDIENSEIDVKIRADGQILD